MHRSKLQPWDWFLVDFQENTFQGLRYSSFGLVAKKKKHLVVNQSQLCTEVFA
jgi:hypothetical protein